MPDNTFGDNKYVQKVFGDEVIDEKSFSLMQKAFELSHDVRKFEIELFWKRGTYYWAFILASFTAYFATMNKVVKDHGLSFSCLTDLPFLSKLALAIVSLLCFFFCLSWVLVNKGSKFWQKNWESHIDVLEEHFSGKLYHTILNTEHSDFKKCPLTKEAYDYSVTKVTTVGSIVLMCVSALLCIFHVVLFWIKVCDYILTWNADCVSVVAGIIIIALMCIATWRLMKCVGNVDKNEQSGECKWRQRNT